MKLQVRMKIWYIYAGWEGLRVLPVLLRYNSQSRCGQPRNCRPQVAEFHPLIVFSWNICRSSGRLGILGCWLLSTGRALLFQPLSRSPCLSTAHIGAHFSALKRARPFEDAPPSQFKVLALIYFAGVVEVRLAGGADAVYALDALAWGFLPNHASDDANSILTIILPVGVRNC
jgi:hypothetical protein